VPPKHGNRGREEEKAPKHQKMMIMIIETKQK
jgi:hypothetical protein